MPEPNQVGPPVKYKPSYNKEVKKLCLLGATDEQIADFFEVDRSTISRWKHDYPKFFKAMKAGKIAADSTVAESLFKSATGYDYEETTTERVLVAKKSINPDEIEPVVEFEMVPTKIVSKHLPPNGRDALNWLKNRSIQNWKDKHEIESTNRNITTVIDWSADGNQDDKAVPEAEGSGADSIE